MVLIKTWPVSHQPRVELVDEAGLVNPSFMVGELPVVSSVGEVIQTPAMDVITTVQNAWAEVLVALDDDVAIVVLKITHQFVLAVAQITNRFTFLGKQFLV